MSSARLRGALRRHRRGIPARVRVCQLHHCERARGSRDEGLALDGRKRSSERRHTLDLECRWRVRMHRLGNETLDGDTTPQLVANTTANRRRKLYGNATQDWAREKPPFDFDIEDILLTFWK